MTFQQRKVLILAVNEGHNKMIENMVKKPTRREILASTRAMKKKPNEILGVDTIKWSQLHTVENAQKHPLQMMSPLL